MMKVIKLKLKLKRLPTILVVCLVFDQLSMTEIKMFALRQLQIISLLDVSNKRFLFTEYITRERN